MDTEKKDAMELPHRQNGIIKISRKKKSKHLKNIREESEPYRGNVGEIVNDSDIVTGAASLKE